MEVPFYRRNYNDYPLKHLECGGRMDGVTKNTHLERRQNYIKHKHDVVKCALEGRHRSLTICDVRKFFVKIDGK